MHHFSGANFHNSYAVISSAVLYLRKWENENLLLKQSALAIDLLAVVGHHSFHGLPLSCKRLYSSLDYSDIAIRKHLFRYVDEGWILIEACSKDRRVRWVKTSPKFDLAMNEYAAAVAQAFGTIELSTSAK